MKTQRPILLHPLFLLTTLLLFLLHPTSVHSFFWTTTSETVSTTATAPAPAPTTATVYPSNNNTEFIRNSCASTRYPKICFSSLSGYANAVQQNPSKLARVAIAVSLSRAKTAAAYFDNLTKGANSGADNRTAAALDDCSSTFGDAVDQHVRSLEQMRELMTGGSTSGENFRFQISNVQTWMSAALTNEDTCKDGFDEVGEGPMKNNVCNQVDKVEAVTSNALALINSFAAAAEIITPHEKLVI